ncbi:unnamed protein product [Caenorhabditis bovis]|uniref:Uncharacterized protein n=1 Tax=Caenorhabditis bovis TaxID=2654633 RepID=A0A8S1EHK4_9PELO|nr:unnamed protein product [Caenorhabditis bovis]
MNVKRIAEDLLLKTQKSPLSASRLVHAIPHTWHRSTKFRFNGDAVCHFCQRPLGFGFLNAWEKCRSCKWKVHTQCKSRVGDSCGLTPDHLRFLFDKLIEENNGGMWNDPQSAAPLPASRSMNENAFQYPDEPIDSSSSANSTAPSTPANVAGTSASGNTLTVPDRNFLFPESEHHPTHGRLPLVVVSEDDVQTEAHVDNAIESEGTIVGNDSLSSNETSNPEVFKFSRKGSGHTFERNAWNKTTIRGFNMQASWNEVTIQPGSIEFDKCDPLIARGRFGDVLRGFHYGDVAIKMVNMDHIKEQSKKAEEFKLEVSAYKNTRHDNIALFLGYFVNKNKFGIVTSLVKGHSLFTLLHVIREKLDIGATRRLAVQICQGISYLHTKKILHRDLRTKNILIENKNKVVLTDFGMMSHRRLCYPQQKSSYLVPKFWLSYVAPEIIRNIKCDFDEAYHDEFPFSEYSDVYAFGSVWYEMLTGEIPFIMGNAFAVLYQKGIGMKDCLHSFNGSREMRDILMTCWSRVPEDRSTFPDIVARLTRIPKKRPAYNPNCPVMVKSYESTF